MKTSAISLILAGSAVVWTGCENPDGSPNNTAGGALLGGAIGAIAGATLGGRHGGEGAFIGAASGVVAGSLIGNAMDQDQSARLQYQAPVTYVRVSQPQPLTTADVKSMSQAGISAEVIINQLRSTHTGFRLSPGDIIDLRNAGVADTVVNFMIGTASDPYAVVSGVPPLPPVVVVDDGPPPPVAETILPAPPAPGYVWISGDWQWTGRWVWVGGHWSQPPRPHATWIAGYWVKGPHGWFKTEGYWK